MPSFFDGILSLGRDVNKTKPGAEEEKKEGIVGEKLPVLVLEKDDKELIALKKEWEKRWDASEAKQKWDEKWKDNEKYWLGEHYTPSQRKTGIKEAVDNLIFEAIETALPIFTRQIAEPVVETIKTPEAEAFARKVGDRIKQVADVTRLRLKVKKAVRHWALYYLGCIKVGWNLEHNEMTFEAIRPQQLVLDPDGVTDECEYDGEYIGHYRTDFAENIISKFPEHAEKIRKMVDGELGTKLRYVEWWTNDYIFFTLKDIVLSKAKNPHWNYDQQSIETFTDEFGNVTQTPTLIRGKNHFGTPKMPFAFLSVFNLGKSPFDNTNLIEQVIPLQDKINKRVRQIDKNADSTNGGSVVSGDHFSKEQAAQVGEALRKGSTVWVPNGDVDRAYRRDVGPPLPQFVYQDLIDSRNELRGIFGVTGLSAQGIKSEETVRGKILVRGQDSDRASLIVDHIEQMYDYIFNWMAQMMAVYYEEPRPTSQGTEVLSSEEFVYPLVVSVKEGSLIPKDRLTLRNEAIDLWSAGALDPLTLAERLEVPDPQEFVRRLVLWKSNPLGLAPELQQQAQPPPEMVEGAPNLLSQVPIQ